LPCAYEYGSQLKVRRPTVYFVTGYERRSWNIASS